MTQPQHPDPASVRKALEDLLAAARYASSFNVADHGDNLAAIAFAHTSVKRQLRTAIGAMEAALSAAPSAQVEQAQPQAARLESALREIVRQDIDDWVFPNTYYEHVQKVAREALAAQPPAATQEEPTLPERDLSKPAELQGLFHKFDVRRADGSSEPGGKHHGCEYFVLDVDHDPHAHAALTAYADAVEATHPILATDMKSRYGLAASTPSPAAPTAPAAVERFKVSHASSTTTPASVLAFAAELEDAIGEVMNGRRKPGKLPVEPMAALIEFARSALSTAAVKAPEGYVLAPIEPTIGMCIAGDEARANVDDPTRTPAIYRAMITAAPAQVKVEGETS